MARFILRTFINIFDIKRNVLINTCNNSSYILYTSLQIKTYSTNKKHKPEKSAFSHPRKSILNNNFSTLEEGSLVNSVNAEDPSKKLIYMEDPDSFGMISRTNYIFSEPYEKNADDIKENDYLTNIPWRKDQLSTKQYADLIKEHIDNKRIKEALDVLQIKMLNEDRVKPEAYIYNVLIDGCARVGYTKKAFMLYNDMKKRNLKIHGSTYTSLFNACANSPWHEDGLSRARHLRSLMSEKAIEPNITNYNSMIKAFGRCGDLQTAFEIVDEMCDKKIKIRVHTYNFLLQSCISNKKAGFQYALITWKKLIQKREKPNIFSFNLMLKCIKDCKIGNIVNLKQVVEKSTNTEITLVNNTATNKNEIGNLFINDLDKPLNLKSDIVVTANLPNLLSNNPILDNVISISEPKTPQDRFMLAGGLEGFIRELNSYKVQPDIKTITQLLDVIPSTLEQEQKILDLLTYYKIKPDISFFNMLIKNRCYRFDYKSAQDVRALIKETNKIHRKHFEKKPLISPDILTYGVLALSCDSVEKAKELLNEMTTERLSCNAEIMGTLLRQGTALNDRQYVTFIMAECKSRSITVNKSFLKHLTIFKHKCKNDHQEKITMMEGVQKDDRSLDSYSYYDDIEEVKHPWTQFRTNQTQTFQRPSRKPTSKRIYKKPFVKTPKYLV